MDAPAGWYPDPLGRYEHRYWDGTRWTDHAARAGQTVNDPVDAAPATGGGATPQDWGRRDAAAGNTEGLAVVSLVLSIVWILGLGSIAGIVTGVIARRRIRGSDGTKTGSGFATAGIVIGVIGLLLTLLAAVAIGAFLAWDVGTYGTALGLASA